jgi:anaerobic ribonucleoside-triphosphate reductase
LFTKIRKRDGREVSFDDSKITDAIFKAALAVGGEDREQAVSLTLDVLRMLKQQYNGHVFSVEDVQDVVEKVLIEKGHARTAKAYILYRDKRTRMRDAKSELMDVVEDIVRETDRDNANVGNSPSAKMLQIASAASRNYYLSRLLDEDCSLAHQRGDIHIHDLDFYATTLNCLQIPLEELLSNGFDNGHGFIRPPKRPASATALSAIILQSSQNDMYGGQSFPFFDKQLAPYIDGEDEEEIYQAMEALVYNLNSMHSRAGSQVPFSSLNLGTDTSEAGRMVIRNLLLAYEAGLGKGENPIFPNIIFRLKKGINFNPEDPNYDLFQLAVRVASKRLNPTFSFMDSSFNKQYGDQVAYMGCRTRVMANRRGPAETTKRGNLSFTTLNLPRLAIKAERNTKKFFSLLDEVIELTLNQLYHRFKVQCRLRVKDIPFVMGQGLYMGSEDLKPDDSIEPAIVNGTLSVGVIGLAETLVALTGYHHGQSEDSQTLGEAIISSGLKPINIPWRLPIVVKGISLKKNLLPSSGIISVNFDRSTSPLLSIIFCSSEGRYRFKIPYSTITTGEPVKGSTSWFPVSTKPVTLSSFPCIRIIIGTFNRSCSTDFLKKATPYLPKIAAATTAISNHR